MDEQIAGTLASAGAQLAVLTAKQIAETVPVRIQAIRKKKDSEEIFNSYEEIINELVADRGQVIAIANAYRAELERYEITDEDIRYLQNTISGILEVLKDTMSPDSVSSVEQLKSLVTADTLKAMQLLGFDYKKAIGDPLTDVCAQAIKARFGQKQTSNNRRQNQKMR